MGNFPKVSVVMSTYNDAAYLAESINSVLGQDFVDFELIVVNDGSPDPRTAGILADYAGRDPRVRVISKANEGLTKALIDGCAAVRGEYIARLDVGDVMTPDRLRRQVEVLDRHPDVVLVSCWTEFCGPEWEHVTTVRGQDLGTDGMVVLPASSGANLLAGPTCHPSVMMRADAYRRAGGYRWQFYYGQDWDLWYRLAEEGRFAMVPDVLYRVRLLPGGITAHNSARQKAIGRCALDAFARSRQGLDPSPALARAAAIRPQEGRKRPLGGAERAGGWYFLGAALYRARDPRCRRYLRHAIGACPCHLKAWALLALSLRLRTPTAGPVPAR